MTSIPFFKLSAFGNNFVVLDETRQQVLTEAQKRRFAHHATDVNFGIGCDNFLVVQPCCDTVLEEIHAENRYWPAPPDTQGAELIFRMFDPDGTEAYSCGNGLMCIARYLHARYAVTRQRVLTKLPTAAPGIATIGMAADGDGYFADLGIPERMPETLVNRSFLKPFDGCIDLVENLDIRHFRATDAIRFFGNSRMLALRGYLVFTGEPHLVILGDNGFSLPDPVRHIFPTSTEESRTGRFSKRRMSTGASLVNFIGYYLAKNYRHLFPKGINVNFVRKIPGEDIIEYRCFERGILKETFACGTGALACAFVMRSLGMVRSDNLRLWPYRCRLHQPDAEIRVGRAGHGWQILGRPTLLFEGRFVMKDAMDRIPEEDAAPSRPSLPLEAGADARHDLQAAFSEGEHRRIQPSA